MTELNFGLVVITGLSANFTPFSIGFLGIVIGLTIIGIKTKKIIFPIISTLIIAIVFVGSYFIMIIYPIGPVLGTILTNEDNIMLTIFLLSAISIPITITSIEIKKSRKKIIA